MRVLMISKAVIVGIYQRKLEEIAQFSDIQLTVLAPPCWDDPSGKVTLERAYTNGYDLRVEPIRFNGSFHFYHFPTLPRLLNDVQPHIVHIDEEPYNFAAWHSLWHSKRIGAKTLFFTWQNIPKQYPPPFSWGERYVLNNVDYALAGTQSAADVYRAKGYTGAMAVIPQFGVDPVLFSPPETKHASPEFVIGYSGRLVPEKGIDVLLRALQSIAGKWRLDIIGQGPERPSLTKLAQELGIADYVHFLGQVPSVQMPDFYQKLDVLVVPSRTMSNWKEQFGRIITEAMACGVPVIGSNSGAIPDVMGDAGLVFPEEDAAALSKHIVSLMNDPDLHKRLAEQGRAQVLAKFAHAQIAAQTVEVYKRVYNEVGKTKQGY